ncbi:MAG: hypothetical protein EOP24_37515 [Hyphomicrobiales bacterium]|nr:MAG: hypothetical protein EOP24_37515 [Hyphomicrobiales bacterium]
MTGTQLATAYVTLSAETSKIPGQIKGALASAAPAADSAGRSIGSKLSAGIGSTLKAGALGVGAAAGAVIGTALSQGMGRLIAIDDAKGKLAGLGHSVEGVATIMDSALKSVKGTAYGLGDAAGIAASAVAAGIKPGEELTKYLSLTGDAATIAGSSLGEMGSIFNKVTTSGKAYTDNLNQLADRGIPIFQWLQEEYGVTADGLSDMVKEGKVDAETFRKVIEENIGGAALESGKTLRGSYENMKAALGRAGASVIEPFLPMMKTGLGALTKWADQVAPKLESGAKKASVGLSEMGRAFMSSGASIDGPATKFETFGAKAREIFDRVKEGAIALWAAIKDPSSEKFTAFLNTVTGSGDGASGAMAKVESGAKTLGGAMTKVGAAVAAGGVALVGLGGDTTTVAVAGLKALGGVMSFFADHTGLATTALAGLAAGFAIARTAETAFHVARVAQVIMMPAEIASRIAMTRALTAQTVALRAHIVAMGGEAPLQQLTLRQRIAGTIARQREAAATAAATSSLAAYAAAQRVAAAQSGVFMGGVRNGAASLATFGARAQGVATAGLASLRSGIGSIVSMLGGPLVVGLAAAGAGIYAFVSSSNKIKAGLEETRNAGERSAASLKEYRTSLDEAFKSSGGNVDSGVKSVVKDQIASVEGELQSAADRMPSLWDKALGVSNTLNKFNPIAGVRLFAGTGASNEDVQALEDAGNKARETQAAFKDLGLENSDLVNGVTGSAKDWDALKFKLDGGGQSARGLTERYTQMRQEFIESKSSASQVRDAFSEINAGAVGAASGVDGLTSAMGRLRGDQMTAEDAQQRVNDALRGFGDAAAQAGYGVVDAAGKIDTASAAGSQLYSAMKSVQSAFDEAGAAAYQSAIEQGQSQEQAAAAAEGAGQRVRDEFIRQRVESGMALETATALADKYGLFPPKIPTQIILTGADEANTKLTGIAALLDNLTQPRQVTVTAPSVSVPSPGGSLGGPSLEVQPRAEGGPIFGSGGPTSDSIPAVLSAGEHVLTADEVARAGGHGAIYRFRAGLRSGVAAFAEGGAVGGIQAALAAGRSKNGNKYVWGGTGPDGFDCSGFVGWLQQIAMGITGSLKRLYTTYDLMGSNGFAGLLPGLGPSGTQFQVGVSQEHMAATIGGQPAESGGSHGDSRIGAPAVGATDPQFSQFFHLPNEKVAGGTIGLGSYGSKRKKVEWTEKNELDLQSADVSVTQANEDLAKVQDAFNQGKKTQADLDQANLKVQKAEARVVELQKKKDDAAAGVDDGPAPQAPALAKAYSEQEMERLNAQLSVDDANERRNEVYAAEDSSENDKLRADMELQKAVNAQKELLSGTKDSGSGDYSLKGILKTFGNRMVDAGIGALEEQDPFGITSSRWVTTDFGSLMGEKKNGGSLTDALKPQLQNIPATFPAEEINGQTGNLPGDVEEWAKKFGMPKVFDNGGWLEPGEMGINLSSRPEPIFNSPDQMRQFMGGIAPAENGAGGQQVDNSIRIDNVTVADINEFRSMLNLEQRKRALSFNRR